jgi:hypothetical protein
MNASCLIFRGLRTLSVSVVVAVAEKLKIATTVAITDGLVVETETQIRNNRLEGVVVLLTI